MSLPFFELDLLTLLGLDHGEVEPHPEDSPTGYSRVSRISLQAVSGRSSVVEDVLVIGLHAAESAQELLLEFWFQHEGEDLAVLVSLQRFLEARVRPLLGPESCVVLAMCNAARAVVSRPPWLGDRRLYYGFGDVHAEMGFDGGIGVSLNAVAWCLARPRLEADS